MIIRPEGWTIPAEAAAVHGITTEIALAVGLPLGCAVAMFDRMLRAADVIVAHNISFDIGIMSNAWFRHLMSTPGSAEAPLLEDAMAGKQTACTMSMASPIIDLPPTPKMVAAGFNKPKPPKLEECIRHFFGEELVGAHDALIDVRACLRVFFHLQQLGAAAPAEVTA